jgi:hypothetical protein
MLHEFRIPYSLDKVKHLVFLKISRFCFEKKKFARFFNTAFAAAPRSKENQPCPESGVLAHLSPNTDVGPS